eukprot:5865401-Lingulodinium_polyedra.AAC.1
MLEGVNGETGIIDWKKAGPYRLHFKKQASGRERLEVVEHVSGSKAEIPEDYNIDKSWVLMDPVHDKLA